MFAEITLANHSTHCRCECISGCTLCCCVVVFNFAFFFCFSYILIAALPLPLFYVQRTNAEGHLEIFFSQNILERSHSKEEEEKKRAHIRDADSNNKQIPKRDIENGCPLKPSHCSFGSVLFFFEHSSFLLLSLFFFICLFHFSFIFALLFRFSLTALRVARILCVAMQTSFSVYNFPSHEMQRQHGINQPRIRFIYSGGDSSNDESERKRARKIIPTSK